MSYLVDFKEVSNIGLETNVSFSRYPYFSNFFDKRF